MLLAYCVVRLTAVPTPDDEEASRKVGIVCASLKAPSGLLPALHIYRSSEVISCSEVSYQSEFVENIQMFNTHQNLP